MLKKDFISKPIIELHCIYMQNNKCNMRQHMTVLQWQNAMNKIQIATFNLYRFCQFYTILLLFLWIWMALFEILFIMNTFSYTM